MDFEGLGEAYYLLEQQEDPLEYCSINIPAPMPFGLPCMPCDLPNEFHLFKSDARFTRGAKVLELTECTGTLDRILCFPSHRQFSLESRDEFGNSPLSARRRFNLPLLGGPPCLEVFLNEEPAGRLVETTRYNCCCGPVFQHLEVQDAGGRTLYDLVSPGGQRGQCLILPCGGFQEIRWEVRRCYGLLEEEEGLFGAEAVGGVTHLFSGLGEYLNKTDLYGLALPEDATPCERALLALAPLFIDYLLF
jgi:hypothetical protein